MIRLALVKAIGVLLGFLVAVGFAFAQAGPVADAIYYRGNILTGARFCGRGRAWGDSCGRR